MKSSFSMRQTDISRMYSREPAMSWRYQELQLGRFGSFGIWRSTTWISTGWDSSNPCELYAFVRI